MMPTQQGVRLTDKIVPPRRSNRIGNEGQHLHATVVRIGRPQLWFDALPTLPLHNRL
jgi:hypothetical protein